MEANYRLQSVRIHTSYLADHSHLDVLGLVLRNRHVRGWVMFFITHQNVRHQRTFTRQERNSEFHSFTMPVFAIFPIELDPIDRDIQLMKESELSTHAKVRYCKKAKFFQDEFSWKLDLNSCWRHEILERKWCNLHNVANVQRVDPFVLIEVSKNVLHICLSHI